MKKTLFVLLAIHIFCLVAMPQGGPSNMLSQPDGEDKSSEEYVIGPEDVLSIVVWDEPELTSKVVVRPDGKVGMPLLNDIHASGLTTKQLQENITESLQRFVTGPRVSVIVQEIHSQVVYVTGLVAKPGVVTLGAPMTIMELLIRSGGLLEFAKAEEIQILRKEGDKPRRIRFNYKTFAEGKDYVQNIRLRNGDMVIVP